MFKIIKIKLEYILTVVILLLIVLWTFSGFVFSKNKQSGVDVYILESSIPIVKTKNVKLNQKNIVINLPATIEPSNIVEIKSEVSGKIIAIVAQEGRNIKKGGIILKIDNERQKKALEQSVAFFNQRKTEYDTEEELVKKGYNAKTKLAIAFTNLKEAEYALKSAEINLENTIIKSPMDGVVDKIPYSIGDMVSNSSSVLTKVHSLYSYKAHTFVSEKQVLDVKVDVPVTIIFANNNTISGNISFVSNIADPETKTYKVDISFFSEGLIPIGMSARVSLPLKVLDAYYVDNNAIFLNDYGVIGIKVLDTKNIVNFVPIEILSEENHGFWVRPNDTNIDNEITLVTLGGNFVKHGDAVLLQ